MLKIKEVNKENLRDLLKLYTQLHNNQMPDIDESIRGLWHKIISDEYHHIIIGCLKEKIVSSCVLVVIPNLTNNQRPYAIIENVITDEDFRGKGYATAVLSYARNIAVKENCYKIMLMTSSKDKSTLDFYRSAGYNSNDKTAFIQWLPVNEK